MVQKCFCFLPQNFKVHTLPCFCFMVDGLSPKLTETACSLSTLNSYL